MHVPPAVTLEQSQLLIYDVDPQSAFTKHDNTMCIAFYGGSGKNMSAIRQVVVYPGGEGVKSLWRG